LFYRIQADKHDLPWHLTAYNYPTLILFPAERLFWFLLVIRILFLFHRKNSSIVFPAATESMTSVNLIRFLLYHLYIDDNVDEQWCKQTNNSFLSMLSSTYTDFSQLSYLVKSFSWMFLFLCYCMKTKVQVIFLCSIFYIYKIWKRTSSMIDIIVRRQKGYLLLSP